MPIRLPRQEVARRLREIADCAERGMMLRDTVTKIGKSKSVIASLLYDWTDNSRWPPDPVRLRKAADEAESGALRANHVGSSGKVEPGLKYSEIEAMKDRAIQARAAHERYWLEQEVERYGLARQGKPLSEQVA